MYKNAKAILIHNNAGDTILLENGSAIMATNDIIADFNSGTPKFEIWQGESWQDYGDTLEEINNYGEIVAYHDGNKLTVVDHVLWENRTNSNMQ